MERAKINKEYLVVTALKAEYDNYYYSELRDLAHLLFHNTEICEMIIMLNSNETIKFKQYLKEAIDRERLRNLFSVNSSQKYP